MGMMRLLARGREIRFGGRPLIMGIVNITDDSFSGDGTLDPGLALARARELTAQGADIIDVGAESARTNRPAIDASAEIARLGPFLEQAAQALADTTPRDPEQIHPPLLSINTWRPAVARETLAVAGDILNDMGGLPDPENARVCAGAGAALLLMHSVGAPKEKHTHVRYDDVVRDVRAFFSAKMAEAIRVGMPLEGLILDPGLDFAKHGNDNLEILRRLPELTDLGRPILLPISRKSFIGRTLGIEDPRERDAATAACLVAGIHGGASIFRVHNVEMAWRTIRAVRLINEASS